MTSYVLNNRFKTFRALSQTFFLNLEQFLRLSATFGKILKKSIILRWNSNPRYLSLEADALPLRHEGNFRKGFYKTTYHSCFR